MEIGKNIKKIRNIRGLTQGELAKKAHISRSYIGDIEGGRYNPSFRTLIALAAALKVDIASFIDGSPLIERHPDDLAQDRIREKAYADAIDSLSKRKEICILIEAANLSTKKDVLRAIKFLEALNEVN